MEIQPSITLNFGDNKKLVISKNEKIRIPYADKVLNVDNVQVLRMSSIFKFFLDDNKETKNSNNINLNLVDSSNFEKTIFPNMQYFYLMKHVDDQRTLDERIRLKCGLKENFSNIKSTKLLSVMYDLDFLEIPPLLDISCKIFVKKLQKRKELGKFLKHKDAYDKIIKHPLSEYIAKQKNWKIKRKLFYQNINDFVNTVKTYSMDQYVENSIDISSDGKLAAGIKKNSPNIFEIENINDGTILKKINIDPKDIYQTRFLCNDKYLLTEFKDEIKIWKVKSGQCFSTLETKSSFRCINCSKERIVTISGKYVYLWEAGSSQWLGAKELLGGNEFLTAKFIPNDTSNVLLMSTDDAMSIFKWNVKNNECINVGQDSNNRGFYLSILLPRYTSYDGKFHLDYIGDDRVYLWNIFNNRKKIILIGTSEVNDISFGFRPDPRIIAIGSDKKFNFFDAKKTYKKIDKYWHAVQDLQSPIDTIKFISNGENLVMNDEDSSVALVKGVDPVFITLLDDIPLENLLKFLSYR